MFCAAVLAGQFELQIFAKDTQDVIGFVRNCTVEIDHVVQACNFTNGLIKAVDPKLFKGEHIKIEIADSRFVPLTYMQQMVSDVQRENATLEYFFCLEYTIQDNSATHNPIKNATVVLRQDDKVVLSSPVFGGKSLIYIPHQYTQKKQFVVEIIDNTYFFNSVIFEATYYSNQLRHIKTIELDKNAFISVAVRASPDNVTAGPVNATLQIGESKVTVTADAMGNALFNVSSFPELKENVSYVMGLEDSRFKSVLYRSEIKTLRWTEFVKPFTAITVAYIGHNSTGISNASLSLSVGSVVLKTKTDLRGKGYFFLPRQYNTTYAPLNVVVTFHDNKNNYNDQKETITLEKGSYSHMSSRSLLLKAEIGMIAGLSVTGCLVFAIIVAVTVVCIRKKKQNRSEKQPLTSDYTS